MGPLDNDSALDFVNVLVESEVDERCTMLLAVLERAALDDWLDIDDAAPAYLAALIVALVRDPGTLAEQRERLLEAASTEDHVANLDDLLGDIKPLRSSKTARLCLRVLENLAIGSDLITTGPDADNAEFNAWVDAISAGLRAPVRRWPARKTTRPAQRQIRRIWPTGTVLALDLGDGHRTYAMLLAHANIVVYDALEPISGPTLGLDEIVTRLPLFLVSINDYRDCPDNWQPVGLAEAEAAEYLPLPLKFMQDTPSMRCTLIISDEPQEELVELPVDPHECVGLERYGVAWYTDGVDERVRCHYAGRPDYFTESLKVQL